MRLTTLIVAAVAALWAPAAQAIDIEEVTSPGGIEAWLVNEPSLPFVALEIRFMGGSSLEADGKRGAINLMTGLIEEGAGELDARGFAEAREALAASYEFDVYSDALSVSARFLTENRDEAVDLLRLALTEPRFDEDAVERVRAQVLAGLRSDATDPQEIAGRAFSEMAYGNHPYGSDQSGTIESVTALTRDDVVDAYERTIARDRVFVGAVGDITAEELGALLDDLLGGLPETGAQLPPVAKVGLDGQVEVIPFDSPQSVVVFGHEGMDRDDPDFFAAYILDQIVGGSGRQSRLMDEVREKRGLTYGIYTYLAPRELADTWQGGVQTANGTVDEVIDLVRAEWARVQEEGVTEAELAEAKTYLTGAYPLRFDGNATVASILVGMQMQGLTPDYVENRNDYIEAVTLEDIARVAGYLAKPDELSFVVVGQPEADVATGG